MGVVAGDCPMTVLVVVGGVVFVVQLLSSSSAVIAAILATVSGTRLPAIRASRARHGGGVGFGCGCSASVVISSPREDLLSTLWFES